MKNKTEVLLLTVIAHNPVNSAHIPLVAPVKAEHVRKMKGGIQPSPSRNVFQSNGVIHAVGHSRATQLSFPLLRRLRQRASSLLFS